jgi:hypothetical protein
MSSSGNEKKEKVIHTRVPESLDDEIKRKATDLGLSVSNLVRNILQHTFGLVEDIVHDSAEVARSARGAKASFTAGGVHTKAPTQPSAAPPGTVVGWHLGLLNVNAVCDACNTILPKGSQAGIGIVDGPGPIPFRCQSCLKELAHDDERSRSGT